MLVKQLIQHGKEKTVCIGSSPLLTISGGLEEINKKVKRNNLQKQLEFLQG